MVVRRSCSNFLYVFEAAPSGPLTPPPGRVPVPPLSLDPVTQAARRLACRSGVGPLRRQSCECCGVGGTWPEADRHGRGDAAELPRRTVARVAVVGAWCGSALCVRAALTIKGASRRKRRPQAAALES